MRFVDQLNNMPSEESIANRKVNQEFANDLHSIHISIRGACMGNRSRRYADGYIVRRYDNEYCQYGFQYLKSIIKEQPVLPTTSYQVKGTTYPASLVSDEYYQHREGLKPISKENSPCQRYIPDLRALLKADGFEVLSLERFACYNTYDVVKHVGVFSPKPTLERRVANVLLGYVIKFAVRW